MIEHVLAHTIPAAFALLPATMHSQAARAMLLAIGLQESRFLYRRQRRHGPARGFWQFEQGGGVVGVLTHPSTQAHIYTAYAALRYEVKPEAAAVHRILEHNDTLACCFARLLLYTLPDALPGPGEHAEGWRQYLEAWRPGKPHRETWDAFYETAWGMVDRNA